MRLPRFFGRRRTRTQEDVLRELGVEGADLSEMLELLSLGEAEVHRFENRLFVTGPRGHGPGVAAPEGDDAVALGELVQRALAYS